MVARVVPKIHARGGDARLDHIMDLVAFVARPRTLATTLDQMPARIAKILRADVCSVYLLEGDDLVMRGNVGFPREAIGEVRLAVGEGLTGMCIESMRPVSVDVAQSHAKFRDFPELDEHQYPVFVAVPVAGPRGALGAIVAQRRKTPGFDASEIELAAALTVPIAAMIERAKLADTHAPVTRAPGDGSRRMTLSARTVTTGRAVGAIRGTRRPTSRGATTDPRPRADVERRLRAAIDQARLGVDDLLARGRKRGAEPAQLHVARLVLDDGRLPELAMERVDAGESLSKALAGVASDAARTAERTGDTYGAERARIIGEVCDVLAMSADADRLAELPRGAVLVGDRFGLFDLLIAARTAPCAIVLAEPMHDDAERALVQLVGVPALADCQGLFRWAGDGDVALVDGDHGLVRLNPSRAEISLVRAKRRRPERV